MVVQKVGCWRVWGSREPSPRFLNVKTVHPGKVKVTLMTRTPRVIKLLEIRLWGDSLPNVRLM